MLPPAVMLSVAVLPFTAVVVIDCAPLALNVIPFTPDTAPVAFSVTVTWVLFQPQTQYTTRGRDID